MQVIGDTRWPIKMWTDGVPVEDSALAQLRNVASLPFIHKHLAVMPDVHWGMGATVGSVIATKGAIVPAAVGVDIGCFRGDTRIPLLDGKQRAIADLVGETCWVYSCTPEGRVVPGKATAVLTRRDAPLVKVTVSGGDEIICTPDHRFMMLDGSYREARELRFNQSLMPLYRRWQSRDGYESCAAGDGRYRLTHELVFEDQFGLLPEGEVIHHKNVNHFDNRPENFEAMTASAHSALHRAIGRSFRNHDPAFQELRLAGIARRTKDPAKAAQMAAVGSANITRYMQERPNHFAASVVGNGARGAPVLAAFNQTPRGCPDCDHVADNPASLRWHREREHASNHKVLAVEDLNERADVYCLQVAEHHNFALAAGVFVHNCGMVAVNTKLTASDLPDNLHAIRTAVEAAVPHGRTANGGPTDKGAWHNQGDNQLGLAFLCANNPSLQERLGKILSQHPKLQRPVGRVPYQIGTLGTGNHFIELCLDESQNLWIMLHSGSRGMGNAIGTYFIERAKERMREYFITLPDDDLAYLPDDTPDFAEYSEALHWAQDFAAANRTVMLRYVIQALKGHFPQLDELVLTEVAVNCHHNYVAKENHFGANVWVTRKGAISAREGQLGIIPGSMGAKSFIVRGKGNPQSFQSCSHGAGRAMSRGEARRRFTLADHAAATAGVECRKDAEVIDETPAAYKSIDAVMAAQTDLVEIVHTLKQVVCVKG